MSITSGRGVKVVKAGEAGLGGVCIETVYRFIAFLAASGGHTESMIACNKRVNSYFLDICL